MKNLLSALLIRLKLVGLAIVCLTIGMIFPQLVRDALHEPKQKTIIFQ